MRSLRAMIKANLKMNVRNRQALFWNLAFPAIFILIFGFVFGRGDDVSFDVGVAGDSSPFQRDAVTAMRSSDVFNLHVGSSESELKKLRDGDRAAVIVFGAAPASGGLP